ncbi:hypothetical protein E4U21_000030 [Claviceps maximensis]|nr:hypothetical protein E4U21_000030 [Claviceps maximensis]
MPGPGSSSSESSGSLAVYPFKVYITAVTLEEQTVVDALCRDDHPDDIDLLSITWLENRLSTQEVIRYHKSVDRSELKELDNPLLIVDSTDLDERGVLLVSTEEYHGYDDGFRASIDYAIELLNTLAWVEDDWYNVRQNSLYEIPKATPVKWFALYNSLSKENEFTEALVAMNDGLQEVLPDEMESEPRMFVATEYYVAIRGRGRSLGQIFSDHPFEAGSNDYDENYFAVIDDDYKQKGPLLVQISPDRDSFRCKGAVAGELLRWIFINFMTWDQAKTLAAGL